MAREVYPGSVDYASPIARARFIRQTYAHLALAVLAFIAR